MIGPGARRSGLYLGANMPTWTGQSLKRREDLRFITGQGHYLDDLAFPGALHAFVFRSTEPHARILSIDTRSACAAPGVCTVLTGEDLRSDGIPPLPCCIRIPLKPGTQQSFPERHILAQDVVRYVGEPVAIVLAETLAQAKHAAGRIKITYESLPFVIDPGAAAQADAPQLHADVPSNTNFVWAAGDQTATDAAFQAAARVVRLDLVNNRVAPTPLEPRGAVGAWNDEEGFTLHLSCQGSHWIKDTLSKYIFPDLAEDKIRVVTPDVGGGFGVKLFLTPEYVLVMWAARRTGRTVKWTCERGEAFLSDTHGRDNLTTAEAALDQDGNFLGLRVNTIANMGAYLSEYAPTIPTGDRMHEGVYVFPSVYVEVAGVFTNTGPVESYRGAGRPEATYMIERLVDLAGRQTGLGPVEIRRRNMVRKDAIPYRNRLGHIFDTGDFPLLLEEALNDAESSSFEERKREAARRGALRGMGISSYIGVCAGEPLIQARIDVVDGKVVATLGTQSSGQGHETAYAQIVADELGMSVDDIVVRQGDTHWMRAGSVTAGSRSITLGGVAATLAARMAVQRGLETAAARLGADPSQVEFREGAYSVIGTNRSMHLFDVARDLAAAGLVLAGEGEYVPEFGTFTNGCHICEVEVDPDTGDTTVVSYVAVDDFGTIINPMLVEGQVHGGVTQGIGQALLEGIDFGADGSLLTRSLDDYAIPLAADLPAFRTRTVDIPCLTNPLGTKGMGEAGAIAAPPAVINAVLEALWPMGVRQIDMPATPEAIWRALSLAAPLTGDAKAL